MVSSPVLGGVSQPAPSDRITLGFIGIGAMGQGHLNCCLYYPEVQIVGVCDVDQWRREHAKAAVESAYAQRQPSGKYAGCEAYVDLRDLLARDDLDAVIIATGDRWHAPATVMAAEAGKDIYCEKPISLTIHGARAMVDAVRRFARVFQGGLQQRSTAEFRAACELVRNGAIGKVRVVYVIFPGTSGEADLPAEPVPKGLDWDLWLGPAPWRPYNKRYHPYGRPPFVVPWHFCRDFGGGNLTSNTVHAFDVVQWGLGMDDSGPVEIHPPGVGHYPVLTYKYANGVLLQVVSGRLDRQCALMPKGWNPASAIANFGALFVGDGGWIHVGREGLLQGFPQSIAEQCRARRDRQHPVSNHHQNWLDCIRTRGRPASNVSAAARATTVSHLGCIAYWTGRALKWDPAAEAFLGDDEANRWRSRAMRSPWRL